MNRANGQLEYNGEQREIVLERRNRANEELCGMNSNDEWSGQEIDWKINGVK